MSNKRPNDGGSASARATVQLGNGEYEWGAPGMTLRDWFAGQALAGLMVYARSTMAESCAKAAYELADAMLAERERRSET